MALDQEFTLTADQFRSFDDWMAAVNRVLVSKALLSAEDLPDVDYRGLFAMNDSPLDAAEYVIEYATTN